MPVPKPKLAILAAEFAPAIIEVMIEEATREATTGGAEVVRVVRVSGAYELPLLADTLLANEHVEILIALGFIERGETQHGEVMGHLVHAALIDLQLKYKKPVGIGIIGPGATLDQAEKRKVDYARSAVQAAMKSWNLMREP